MEIGGPGSALATRRCLDRGAIWKALGSAPASGIRASAKLVTVA